METNGNGGCLLPLWFLAAFIGGSLFFIAGARTTVPAMESAPTRPETPTALIIILAPEDADASWQDLQAAQRVIEQRLQTLFASGQLQGPYSLEGDSLNLHITVQISEPLPDTDLLIDVLTRNGALEFVVGFPPDVSAEALVGSQILMRDTQDREASSAGETPDLETIISNQDIESVIVQQADRGPVVEVTLTDAAATRLSAYSRDHTGTMLAIVLDGTVVSAPVITSPLSSPIWISGRFSDVDAAALAAQINSPQLPLTLEVTSITQSDMVDD
jgi:preprotein translocase subunit SecD